MNRTNARRAAPADASSAPHWSPPNFPKMYIIAQKGERMLPLIADGARLAVSSEARPVAGDVIIIWFRPVGGPANDIRCIVRRMTLDLPYYVKGWPHRERPESECHAALMYEQLNPPEHYGSECCKVLAVHKVLGDQVKVGKG